MLDSSSLFVPTVCVAQLVRASVCGTEGCRFESDHAHLDIYSNHYRIQMHQTFNLANKMSSNIGVSPSGTARGFDPRIHRFESCHLS